MPLITGPSADNFSVGSTTQYFGLDGLNHESQNLSAIVRRIDFSCPTPAAVFELELLRVESSGSSAGLSRFFRGNQVNSHPDLELSTFVSPTISHRLGRYYHHAASGLFVLEFPDDGFEALRDAETNADHRPVLSATRVDTSTAVDVHVNFWYEEY